MESPSTQVIQSGYIIHLLFFKGSLKKLHHPWTGLFKIVKQILESDYKSRNVQRKKKLQEIHFALIDLNNVHQELDSLLMLLKLQRVLTKLQRILMITLYPDILDKIWSLLKVDQDNLSHIIQEEIEVLQIVMYLPLLTRTYKFGTNSRECITTVLSVCYVNVFTICLTNYDLLIRPQTLSHLISIPLLSGCPILVYCSLFCTLQLSSLCFSMLQRLLVLLLCLLL